MQMILANKNFFLLLSGISLMAIFLLSYTSIKVLENEPKLIQPKREI